MMRGQVVALSSRGYKENVLRSGDNALIFRMGMCASGGPDVRGDGRGDRHWSDLVDRP